MPTSHSKDALVALGAVGGMAYYFWSLRSVRKRVKGEGRVRRGKKAGSGASYQDLMYVLRSLGKREMFNFGALTACLLGRTWFSLWIAESMARTVKAFTHQNWPGLNQELRRFARWTVLASILNALLKHSVDVAALNVRQRLTRVVHKLYMNNMNYYKANFVGPDKLENADQLIADDVDKFSDGLADVFSQALKPCVDFVMYTAALAKTMGVGGPGGLLAWFAVSATLSTAMLPPFGQLAAREQKLEGRFRAAHASLITNAEMVAFMQGEVPEQAQLDSRFADVRSHVKQTLALKLPSDVAMGYLNKYFASVVGFVLTALPIYRNPDHGMSASDIAGFYVKVRHLMEAQATAVLALFELQKRMGRLKGLSSRVAMLLHGLRRREPILEEVIAEHAARNPPAFVEGAHLKFEGVSVYKPDGVLLLDDLNLEVTPGMRVIVTGDNGAGKSSLFRVICGLWPLVGGTITKPPTDKIYFLSQVNFVPIGTLREIVMYPDTELRAGRSDADVLQALDWAHIADLECDGVRPGLDDQLDWHTALSPGQKQRMAFARLYYNRPVVAVLDECTNGVAPDVERDLYRRCAALGMSIFSISHKVELKALHHYELHYAADGTGGYELTEIGNQESLDY